MYNYFCDYAHVTDVGSNQDRIWHSSARSNKLYGKTCQQGVIQSGLRQCFNSNLEGPAKVLWSELQSQRPTFSNYKKEKQVGLQSCHILST